MGVSFKNCLFKDTGLNEGFFAVDLRSIFVGDVLPDLPESFSASVNRVESFMSEFPSCSTVSTPTNIINNLDLTTPLVVVSTLPFRRFSDLESDDIFEVVVVVVEAVEIRAIFESDLLVPRAAEFLIDLFASTSVVERSTTDCTRGLSTFPLVRKSAITIFDSTEVNLGTTAQAVASIGTLLDKTSLTRIVFGVFAE